MPQFELANFVPQLAWLTIFFTILYFGIVQLTLPKLGRTMAAREDQVTGDLTIAENAKAQADAMADSYAVGIEAAHRTARAAIADAKGKAAANVEARVAAGNEILAKKAAAADVALAEARGHALNEIETVAADAAADIVERLTGVRPDGALVMNAAKAAVVA